MYKNVASQRVAVYAHDTAADTPKTGDAANITAQISLDGGATAASNDTNPTELDATDAPGVYIFDTTQAETNCDLFILFAKSSTADIQLEPVIAYTLPGTNAGVLADTVAISGDSAAADNLEAWMDSCHAGTAQAGAAATITLTAGAPSVNLAGSVICLSGGTGARQARVIVGYDTGTKVANIYPNWGTNPDNTTTYIVLTGVGPSDIESILRDSAPTDGLWTAMMQYNSNNYFSANVVAIENTALANLFDTDSGETYGSAVAGSPVKEIADNVTGAWPTAAANADAVWDEARSGHTTAGTYGESYLGIVNGQAASGTLSTTQMTTNLTEATDDHYNGRIVVFITGDLAGQATDITDYTGATKLITMTALTEAPISGNRFVIV